MENASVTLEILSPNHKKTLKSWYYNPIVSFLAFPEVASVERENIILDMLENRLAYIIQNHNEMIGCILFSKKETILIHSIFIKPEYRGLSFSKTALKKFINFYQSQKISAKIQSFQREQKQLFLSCGFRNTEEESSYLFEDKKYPFQTYIHD